MPIVARMGNLRRVGVQHTPLLRHSTDRYCQFPGAGGEVRAVEVLAGYLLEPRGRVIDPDRADQDSHRRPTSPIGHVGGNVVHVAMQGFGDRRRRPAK
jgi:hypothetical protein